MIISASRRTDIPAFYAQWLVNRVRAGYCTVPNPFNRGQVARISLKPEDVDVIVFWTRNPRPLFPFLDELDDRGYRYYFQYTLLNNPRIFDAACPALETAVDTFNELAQRISPQRIIWRYDPILFSSITGTDFHLRIYESIARMLRGATYRSVISILDEYPKTSRRMQQITTSGIELYSPNLKNHAWVRECIQGLASIAASNGMSISSCAEEREIASLGVRPGKCVDDEYILETFGKQVNAAKDPNQRKLCGCVASKDIGMYDSCIFGCQYCYATSSFETARKNHASHQPNSPSLIGWYE